MHSFENKRALNNLFHYILIFLTIFSADMICNFILYPESDKNLILIGYLLYFLIIAPLFFLLLKVINIVSQFSPSDDSSFFAFWSFLMTFAQLFPLLYKYLPKGFSSFSVLGALIISISYGIFWSIYAKNVSESERKVLFLLTQILILILIQFGTYLNVTYVRSLFTRNGLVLNISLITIFIICMSIGRRIATFIIGKHSIKERTDQEEYKEIITNIKKSVVSDKPPKADKNELKRKTSGRSYAFTLFLIILNAACFIYTIILPVKEAKVKVPRHSYAKMQDELKRNNTPNIILIVLDTVRTKSMDLYDYDKPTMPKLKQWASSATLYKRAYANSSWSLATHASIFTGLYPSSHKAQYHYTKVFEELDRPITAEDIYHPLTENHRTLAEDLSKKGYYTAAISANSKELDPEFGLSQGFNYYDARPRVTPSLLPYRLFEPADSFITPLTKLYTGFRSANAITEDALEWCEKNKEKKFFLFLNYMEGNLPLVPIPRYKKMFYDDKAVRKSRYPEQLKQILYYCAELRYLDDQLNMLLESLKSYDWYENSIIIITSSHGISLGEWGHWGHSITLNEWDVRIPLIIKYPRQKDGAVTEYSVQTADIFPTVIDIAGASVPSGIDGRDLRTDDQSRFIAITQKPSIWVVEKYDNQYFRTLRAFIVGDEKVIISSNGPPQVYNLKDDPEERNNIASSRMDLVRKTLAEFKRLNAARQSK